MDHIVLNVVDVERSLAWYADRLGLAAERVEEWRRSEVLFPSLRIDETTVIDLMAVGTSDRSGENVDHYCLVVAEADVDELAGSGAFDVVAGPMEVWGAQGMARAIYVRDPDGNTVELRKY